MDNDAGSSLAASSQSSRYLAQNSGERRNFGSSRAIASSNGRGAERESRYGVRRRMAEEHAGVNSNTATNSPRHRPTSPKVSRWTTHRHGAPSSSFDSATQRRLHPAVDSSSNTESTTNPRTTAMHSGVASSASGHGRHLLPRASAATSSRRTASNGIRNNPQSEAVRQMEADAAMARSLQLRYDREFRAEQLRSQRRQRELDARRWRNRPHDATHRSSTPPIPTRDRGQETDGDDEEDEEHQVWRIVLEDDVEQSFGTRRDQPRARNRRPLRASSNGPVRRVGFHPHLRHLDIEAELFPDINISVLDFEALLELADELGDVAPSMSPSEINRLPTTVYVAAKNDGADECAQTSATASALANSGSSSDAVPTCPICMDKFCDGDVQRILPCFHSFHKDCVDVWLKQKSSCPVCRVDARNTSPALASQ